MRRKRLLIYIYLFLLWITNRIINYIPINFLRKMWYRFFGMKVGKKAQIDMGQYFLAPWRIEIGKNTHINQSCIIDGRSKIVIGDNVSISHRVCLMTGSHDIMSEKLLYKGSPIIIKDRAFIGVNATILQGVTIGRGAVVCAGSVVTKDVEDFAIVAGVPARKIGVRESVLTYQCNPDRFFM